MTRLAIVTGACSGLGYAITNQLLAEGWEVHGVDLPDTEPPAPFAGHPRYSHFYIDLRRPGEIESLGESHDGFPVDALINCAGINHLTPFDDLNPLDWDRLMDVNARALWLTTQALAGSLNGGGTVLNIVSNAAHIPMTHSLAYNASKGAALMVTKQMARELHKTHGIYVFSISPNKIAGTAMSRQIEAAVPALRGWTEEEAEAYQRAALPIGEETPPGAVAEFIAFLLANKERHRYLHGCNIPYGA